MISEGRFTKLSITDKSHKRPRTTNGKNLTMRGKTEDFVRFLYWRFFEKLPQQLKNKHCCEQEMITSAK